MRYEVSEEINAPVGPVWTVLADVERWPDWSPTMTSVRRRDGATFGPGSSALVRQPKLPPMVWRVTAFEPGQRFTWETTALGITTSADHLLEPLGADRCRITLSVHNTGRLARVLTAAVWPMTCRYVATEARSLRRRCEAHPVSGDASPA